MDKNELLNNQYIRDLMNKYRLPTSFVEDHAAVLSRIARSQDQCFGCGGLATCRQAKAGERLCARYDGALLEEVEYCPYGLKDVRRNSLAEKYLYCDVPKDMLELDLNTITPTAEQQQLYAMLLGILNKRFDKGLYISGSIGSGKTYLCTALANSLVRKGEKVAFVKIANFFNEIRACFNTDPEVVDRKINILMKADYLIMDDLGAEVVSDFVRDDVLFRILDYRMENRKMTIFTSNLNTENLVEHYQYDRKNKSNEMKARRLVERIEVLTDQYVLTGTNLRRK